MKYDYAQLLKDMGLKVGDQVKFRRHVYKLCFNHSKLGTGEYDVYPVLYRTYLTIKNGIIKDIIPVLHLIGQEYSVIAQPKYTLTETEKHIVLAIDEQIKWIARSIYGNLFVYVSKPIKKGDAWFRNALDYYEFYPFNHHFQFIQWSDTEPVSLDELREIAKK